MVCVCLNADNPDNLSIVSCLPRHQPARAHYQCVASCCSCIETHLVRTPESNKSQRTRRTPGLVAQYSLLSCPMGFVLTHTHRWPPAFAALRDRACSVVQDVQSWSSTNSAPSSQILQIFILWQVWLCFNPASSAWFGVAACTCYLQHTNTLPCSYLTQRWEIMWCPWCFAPQAFTTATLQSTWKWRWKTLKRTAAPPWTRTPLLLSHLLPKNRIEQTKNKWLCRGCPQQAPVAPKHPTACANQPPHASVSGRVDHGSVCCRDYARTETSLACIHGAEEPTK